MLHRALPARRVTDYARHTSMPLAEAERWLRPILGYEEDAKS